MCFCTATIPLPLLPSTSKNCLFPHEQTSYWPMNPIQYCLPHVEKQSMGGVGPVFRVASQRLGSLIQMREYTLPRLD